MTTNKMLEILIVRHGHSVANELGIFAGATDAPLSQIGKQQAELVSNYILQNYTVDAIYSSELQRAKNTVRLVSEKLNLPIITNSSFNEIFGGKWENQTFEEIFKKYPEDLLCWRDDIANSRCTDGESFVELCKRTVPALEAVAEKHSSGRIIIATHAGVTRAILSTLLKLSPEECAKYGWVSNASITTLTYSNNNFTIKEVSYDEYLSSLKTSLPKSI